MIHIQFSRCKREEVEVEKKEKQHNQKAVSESVINFPVTVFAKVDFSHVSQVTDVKSNGIEFSNLTSTTTSAANNDVERTALMCSCIKQGNYHGPPCFNPSCQHFLNVSNSFYSVQREASEHIPGYENGSRVLLPLHSNVSFNNYGGYNQFKVEANNSSLETIDCRDENQEKDHDKVHLSAIERARQREIGENPNCQQKSLKDDHSETIKPNSKTTSDVALAFRSPHRQVFFLYQPLDSCTHL